MSRKCYSNVKVIRVFISLKLLTIFNSLEFLKESYRMYSNKVSCSVVIININMTDIFTQFSCSVFVFCPFPYF